MFAVIKTGGKQYKVEEGQKLRVESLNVTDGENVEFRDVLLVDTGESVLTDTKALAQVVVTASVLGEGRGDKVIVFKKKRRKQYKRFKGHRQDFTEVQINKINI